MATINGTSGNDTLVGTTAADTISGLGGNDLLQGSDGNDSVVGGAGNDTVRGNNGTDWVEGGAGNDNVGGGGGQDSFVFREAGTANADVFNDFSTNWDNIQLDAAFFSALGSAGQFSSGDARFWSSSTGTAHDASDRVIYNTSTRQLWYDADGNGSGAAQLIGTLNSGATVVATDIRVFGTPGSGNPTINGTAGDDTLTGSADADSINGLAGNDTIDGAAGADTLTGGAGIDTFVMAQAPGAANADLVTDFVTLEDKILLDGAVLTNIGPSGDFSSSDGRFRTIFGGSSEGRDADDRVIFDRESGQLFYDPDGSGPTASQRIALLPDTVLQASDFTVINGNGSLEGHLVGTSGDDNLAGGDANDTLEGLAGNDLLSGNGGSDFLDGGSGNDSLNGGSLGDEVDTLLGGDGNDVLNGEHGADSIDGGQGNDHFVVDTTDILSDPGGFDTIHIGTTGEWTMPAFAEALFVSFGTPSIIGNELNNQITGWFNADRLDGRGGNDFIDGGDDNDTLLGGDGGDTMLGGSGADVLDGGVGNDWLDGAAGQDTVYGGVGTDTLTGGTEADDFLFDQPNSAHADLIADFVTEIDDITLDAAGLTAIETSGSFNVNDARFWAATGAASGHDADDRIVYNTLTGDLYYDPDGNGSAAAQRIATLQGAPTLSSTDLGVINGEPANGDVINGTSGNDSLAGGPGDDTINGLGGDDQLSGNAGNDSLDGGDGSDFLDGGAGNDRLLGGDGDDNMWVNTGDDFMSGGAGRDSFTIDASITPLGYGNDTIDGGADALDSIFLKQTSALSVDLGAGTLTGGIPGSATVLNIEDFFVWRDDVFDDRMVGNASNNHLSAGGGNDSLVGAAGNDTLSGDTGNDTLTGGTGVDVFRYMESASAANADQITDFTSGQDVFWLDGRLHNVGAFGNFAAGDDRFYAAAGANAGHDSTDRVVYDTTSGNLWIDLDGSGSTAAALLATLRPGTALAATDFFVENALAPWFFQGGSGNEQAIGTELNDTMNGGAGDDILLGNGGNDQLNGEEGNDIVDGGLGNDTLLGGSGADAFRFASTSGAANADQINGFISFDDQVVLDGSVYAGIGTTGDFGSADARFWSSSTGAAHDADDRVVYNTSNGQLWFDADGNGSGARQLIATLQGAPTLVAADITVANGSGSGSGGSTINGTAGNDSLAGTAGDDTINGFAGMDTIDGGAGADSMVGGDDPDIYFVDNPGDVIVEFEDGGFDTVNASVSYVLPDWVNHLTLIGGAAINGAGNELPNTITGNASGNTLSGYGGNDSIFGGDGLDIISGDLDAEIPGDDYIEGGAGDDQISPDQGNDTALGGSGDDSFIMFSTFSEARSHNVGNDSIDGGSGIDGISFGTEDVGSTEAVTIDLTAGTYRIADPTGEASGIVLNVENVGGSLFADLITGTEGANRFDGLAGNDTIRGLGGNDVFDAEGGDQFWEGGAGNDTMRGSLVGDDTLSGGAGNDLLEGNALTGSSSTLGNNTFLFDVAPGVANADVIVDFTSGQDKLTLDGGAHANSGASGNFTAGDARFWSSTTGTAHDADDRVVYNTATGELWYDTDGDAAGARQLIATLQGAPTLAATDITIANGSGGGGGGSTINGTSGNDALSGTAGNDTINGLGGNDTIDGSAGADVIDGGAGNDIVQYRTATSGIVANFATGSITGGFPGASASFSNVEKVLGSNLDDQLTGNASGQNLTGQGGNDTLAGAGGVDTLWGGGGNDFFVFREMGTVNADRVSDWAAGDKVQFDDSAFTAIGALGNFAAGDARFWSSTAGTAHDANDRVIYNTTTGQLYYDADGNGGGAAQLVATILNHPVVAATDISVI